jgi:hypothetical protein
MTDCQACHDHLAPIGREFCSRCWTRIPYHMRNSIERGRFRANAQALNYLREQARARAEGQRRPGRQW